MNRNERQRKNRIKRSMGMETKTKIPLWNLLNSNLIAKYNYRSIYLVCKIPHSRENIVHVIWKRCHLIPSGQAFIIK